ncbi:MAG: alpha/beta fold hydrolase [Ktedonobacterales bacterium]
MVGDPTRTTTSDAGPVIVFIHGSGDSGRSWSTIVERLPQYTCVALDLPGHGAQIEPPGPDVMSVGDYADAVRALLAERDEWSSFTEDGRGVCLVGHSLGSAVALRLAVDHPALVTHLVLVGAGARLRVLPTLLEEARTQPDEAMRKLVTLGLAPDREAEAPHYFDALQPAAPGVLHRDLSACNDFDMMAELGSITQPTLIVVGEADRLTPPKYAAFLHDHIAGAELRTIPKSGHYVPAEAPDALADALRDWLSRHA